MFKVNLTSFKQSECFISVQYSYATLEFVYDIYPRHGIRTQENNCMLRKPIKSLLGQILKSSTIDIFCRFCLLNAFLLPRVFSLKNFDKNFFSFDWEFLDGNAIDKPIKELIDDINCILPRKRNYENNSLKQKQQFFRFSYLTNVTKNRSKLDKIAVLV